MKRITTTLAISALFALTACKGGDSTQAMKYIPADAELVGGVSITGVVADSKQKAAFEKEIANDEEAKQVLDALIACNLNPWDLERAVFGAKFDETESIAAVVTGKGIGDPANINCISDKIKEITKLEQAPLQINGNQVSFFDGDGFAYLVDSNTVAFASKSWDASVKELIDGKGKSVADGGLKDALALTDTSKHVWGAATLPKDFTDSGPAAGLSMVGTTMHSKGGGLEFTATGMFAESEQASTASTSLSALKPMASVVGVPSYLVQAVKIEADGKKLKITGELSKEDLERLEKDMQKLAADNGDLMGDMGGLDAAN